MMMMMMIKAQSQNKGEKERVRDDTIPDSLVAAFGVWCWRLSCVHVCGRNKDRKRV